MPPGYPWAQGDLLLANDLNAAIANAGAVNTVFDVMTYGAKCDGVTDDTAAVNACFAAVRATSYNWGIPGMGPLMHGYVRFPNNRSCLISGTINATGLQGYALVIDGGGCTLDCHVAGAACIDMLGSLFFHVKDLTIVGNATTVPTIGIQIGRTNITSLSPVNNIEFDNVTIDGTFSLTAFYNFAGESSVFNCCLFWNHSSNANSYCVIQDGFNHFGVTSAFVTQSAPANTSQSFNSDLFISLDARHLGAGRVAWIGGANTHKFIASYAAVTAAVSGVVVLFAQDSAFNCTLLYLDLHCEGPYVDAYLVSGPQASQQFTGLTIIEQTVYATNSLLKADTGVTAVRIYDADFKIAGWASGNLFDTTGHAASIWTCSGRYASALATQFNAVNWSGPILAGQSYTLALNGAATVQTISASGQTVAVPIGTSSTYLSSTAGAAVTGMMLAAAATGQYFTVINHTGFTLTWVNTSVVGGPALAANTAQLYVYAANGQWWPA